MTFTHPGRSLYLNSIEQLRIVLDVGMDVADPLLEQSRRLFHQQWKKQLATLLQQFSEHTEGTVRLAPITLDLGEIPLAQFDAQFGERLLSGLAAKLRPMMVGSGAGNGVSLREEGGSETIGKTLVERDIQVTGAVHPVASTAGKLNSGSPRAVATVLTQFTAFLTSGIAAAPLSEHLSRSGDDWLLAQLQAQPQAWRWRLAPCCLSSQTLGRLLQSAGDAGLSEVCNLLFERQDRWPAQDPRAWAFCLMVGALSTQVRQAPSALRAPDPDEVRQLLPILTLPVPVLALLAQTLVQLSYRLAHTPAASAHAHDFAPCALSRWLRLLCFEAGQWQHISRHISQPQRHRLQRLLRQDVPPGEPGSQKPEQGWLGNTLPPNNQAAPGHKAVGASASSRAQRHASVTAGLGQAPKAPMARPGPEKVVGHDASETLGPWPVSNAGLVLFWPLLPGLFSRWGLLDEGRFIDRRAQDSAVCWLDEWLWADRAQAQWRTPLTKLLCGMELEASLFPWCEPEVPAMTRLDELLEAFLAQTPTLARCGTDDARTWFLQRSGWLHCKDQQWTLQVEEDACDVLLFDLPWSKNQVVLPWMNSPLKVLWP